MISESPERVWKGTQNQKMPLYLNKFKKRKKEKKIKRPSPLEIFLSHLLISVLLEAETIKINAFLSYLLGQISHLLFKKVKFLNSDLIYPKSSNMEEWWQGQFPQCCSLGWSGLHTALVIICDSCPIAHLASHCPYAHIASSTR